MLTILPGTTTTDTSGPLCTRLGGQERSHAILVILRAQALQDLYGRIRQS